MDEEKLIEKLRLIEALHAGATTTGEREAAANALDRVRERLKTLSQTDHPVEYKFSLADAWSRKLMTALLRRYGIKPYRYKRQRRTTVMARLPASFVDQTLWPEFRKLNETLMAYLSEVTERVISEGVHNDSSEVDVVPEGANLLPEG
ncbi:MAG: hypothetical protein ACKVJX_00225 [Verrucomicrobiia bacterium]|jgi:hypothetical protein